MRVCPQKREAANPFPHRQCFSCRWWQKGLSDGDTGYCHRHAPTEDRRPFPILDGRDWCGEWEAVEQPRLVRFGVGREDRRFRFLKADDEELYLSQEFATEGEAHEAEGLGHLEWTPQE